MGIPLYVCTSTCCIRLSTWFAFHLVCVSTCFASPPGLHLHLFASPPVCISTWFASPPGLHLHLFASPPGLLRLHLFADGTANNVYTAWTQEALYDYVSYVATHVLLDLPEGCDFAAVSASAPTVAAAALINSYADTKQLFTYAMHAHRSSARAFDATGRDSDWMREMPTRATAVGRAVCNDTNVACDEAVRWHVAPAVAPFGGLFPVWAFHAPRYRVFNLFEPFGDGNVVRISHSCMRTGQPRP